jgi:hypothetical protein
MKITYDGPIDAVEIAETGQVVERGHSVEVPDELGKRLCEQDIWSETKRTVTKKDGE